MRVGPVPMELDDVRVFEPGEVVEHHLYLILLGFEVLPLGELHLVPDDLDAFLGVHRQVCAVDPGDITLFHLESQYLPIIVHVKYFF